jgi:Tfp pilus assembly protein PilF
MKKANLVLMAALAAAGAIGVTGGVLVPTVVMADDAAKPAPAPKLSPKIIPPLKAVQDATTAKNWDAAYAAVQQAQAVEPKTPYDAYMIDELSWYVLYERKDLAGAAATLERAVNSPFVPPADATARMKPLAQIYAEGKNYAKATEYGNKYLAASPKDTNMAIMVTQSYYLLKDYPNTRATAEKYASTTTPPNEQLLRLALASSVELKDRASVMKNLETLVRYYPSQKYWEDLLTNQLYETKGDREMRTLYRLMEQTNTLDKGDEYSEFATVLLAGGFPGEAQKVLESAMATNAFTGDAKAREQGDLDKARSQAATDRKDLPNAEKALAAAKTGNEMVATGKLYFSAGEYAKAADAIQKGLAKGGVTDTDDANALLGVAQVRAGDLAAARPAFEAVKDAKYASVTRLWLLYIETKATPAAAATG